MLHVDDGQLHAYLDGEVEALGRTAAMELERHLAGCAACKARLEEAKRVRERARAILRDDGPTLIDTPPFEAIVAQSKSSAIARPARRRLRTASALAWAASIALALGLGWYVRGLDPRPERIAMQEESSSGAAAPQSVAVAETGRDLADESVELEMPPATKTAEPVPPPPAPVETEMPTPATDAPQVVAAEPAPAERLLPPSATGGVRAEAAAPEVSADAVATGRVTDPSGAPLAGAQVFVTGLGAGTMTAEDGSYSLTVPASRVPSDTVLNIRVQMIGMGAETQRLVLKPGEIVTRNFQLEPTALTLNEIVVTGMDEEDAAARGRPDAAAAPAEAGEFADSTVRWEPVTRAEAERRLGMRLLLVDGLPIVELAARAESDSPVVRTVQRLAGGELLELVQRRAPPADQGDRGETARLRSAMAPSGARREADAATFEVRIGDALVTARAPVSTDSLDALITRLR